MKRFVVIFLICVLICLCGCEENKQAINIDDIEYKSKILCKEMLLKVYTPSGYNEDSKYPVLYFLPDYGGSVYTVMEQYNIAVKAESLIAQEKIEPIIIVAVDIDRSFGLNSSENVASIETKSGKRFDEGMYQDYFLNEIIPLIDEKYSTLASKQGRYIGGYSMGGFAALHISFKNPELFSKAGGHSPSIFIDKFPDETVSDWLYPTKDIRKDRDPVYLAQSENLDGLSVFIDFELGGSSGVEHLYNVLIDNGVDAQYEVLALSHSRASCNENMERYLEFYAGK